MNTLFITHHYLSSNGGGSFASRAYINAFAQLSSHMTLLYPVKEGENLFEGINPDIETVPVEYNVSKLQKFIHLLSGKVHRYFQIARKISFERSFDIVVFDTSIVSFRLIDSFKKKGSTIVVIHHNYQYEYFRDNTPRILKLPILFWCKKYEGQAVKRATVNLTLTEQDRVLLANQYNKGDSSSIKVLGVFEYKETGPKPISDDSRHGHRFIITGDLGAIQTKESLMIWIRDYFPVLKETIPDSKLTIAGKNPDCELERICQEKQIQLIPSPVSMDPLLKESDYYICPVSLGGGMKLRVLDGLKWGLPVIAHSVSTRGYDAFMEQGIVYSYSTPDEFRQHLLIMIQSSILSRSMITEKYRDNFSKQSGIDKLSQLMFKR